MGYRHDDSTDYEMTYQEAEEIAAANDECAEIEAEENPPMSDEAARRADPNYYNPVDDDDQDYDDD